MRIIIFAFIPIIFMGCSTLDQSKWESNLQATTKLYTDRPQVIEAIDLSAGVKRSW